MTISAGTPFQFEADQPELNTIDKLSSTAAIGMYYDPGNSDRPTAVAFTSSGTAGTPFEVYSDSTSRTPAVVSLTSTTALAVWRASSGFIRAATLSISGTTVTRPGTVYTSLFAINTTAVSLVNLTATTSLFVYTATTGSSRDAMVISVAGTVVSFGTPLAGWAPGVWAHIDTCALSSTKVLACYDNLSNSNYGTATILNISGTTVTDGGVDTVFQPTATSHISVADVSATAALVAYDDNTIGEAQIISVSGSTPTSNTAVSLPTPAQKTSTFIFDSTHGGVFVYNAPNLYAEEIGISGTTVTNPSSDSYIGAATYAAGVAFDATTAIVSYDDGSNGDAVIISLTASGSHLWLSTDGAATFTDIGDSATWLTDVVGGVVVVPGTAYQTIYAAVGTDLYVTINGGTAWTLETAVGYEVDFIDLEKDNTTVILANRASGGNRASLWDGVALTHINTGKSTTGGATSGGDVV